MCRGTRRFRAVVFRITSKRSSSCVRYYVTWPNIMNRRPRVAELLNNNSTLEQLFNCVTLLARSRVDLILAPTSLGLYKDVSNWNTISQHRREKIHRHRDPHHIVSISYDLVVMCLLICNYNKVSAPLPLSHIAERFEKCHLSARRRQRGCR